MSIKTKGDGNTPKLPAEDITANRRSYRLNSPMTERINF